MKPMVDNNLLFLINFAMATSALLHLTAALKTCQVNMVFSRIITNHLHVISFFLIQMISLFP